MRLSAAPPRESVTLLLGAPPAALVQEVRPLDLPAGETTLLFAWTGTKVVPDSLELTVEDAGVGIAGPVLPADLVQHAQWTLHCPQAVSTRLTLSYLMNGLTWAPEYVAVLDGAGSALALDVVAAVRNDSGEDFEDAQIDLGLSAPIAADLEHGATLRLPYVTAREVACRLVHVLDLEKSPDTQVRLELENTEETGLGVAPLPEGKLRVYQEQSGERLLVGEVRFPHTPVGAEAELVLGTAREVSVERRVLRAMDVDIKKDVHGRMALWDREEDIALLIESQKNEDILLRIVEKIDGEWRMLNNSHEFERTDADHIEFLIPVPAHAEVTVRYKVCRLNIMP